MGFDPAGEAVIAFDAEFGVVGLRVEGVERGFDGGPDEGEIFGEDAGEDEVVEELVAGEAENFLVAVVPGGDFGEGVVVPPAHVGGVESELALLCEAFCVR